MKNIYKSTFVAFLLMVLCSVAMAQTDKASDNLFEALDAEHLPSKIRVTDLDATWRVMEIKSGSGLMDFFRMSSGMMGPSIPFENTYFSKGKVLHIAHDEFLVTYQPNAPTDRGEQQYYEEQFESMFNDKNPAKSKSALLANTTLSLSLIPLSEEKRIGNIRFFDPKTDIAPMTELQKTSRKAARTASQSNLKQIALGMLMYTQDYDEEIPPMVAAHSADDIGAKKTKYSSHSAVQTLLLPYVKDKKLFLHPTDKAPYIPNYKVSRKNMSKIARPSETFMFFENKPDEDGYRNVAFMDGHVQALQEDDFQRRRKQQGISQSGYPAAMKQRK